MELKNYHEVIGVLAVIKTENNQTKLIFTLSKEIEIPPVAVQKEKLEGLVGQRIGVFNCNGEYKIRKIKRR